MSTDVLLGMDPAAEPVRPRTARLRRMEQAATLSPADQQTILSMLDALLENRGIKQAS